MEELSSRLTLITRFCWLWGLIVFWRKAFCVNEKMLHRVTSLSCLSRCVQSWVQPPGRQSYHTYIVFPWVRSARRSAFNINCMVCQLRNVIIWSQGVRPSILITHTHTHEHNHANMYSRTHAVWRVGARAHNALHCLTRTLMPSCTRLPSGEKRKI